MAGNTLFAFISLLVTAGGCVMMFMVLLGGTRDSAPLNKIYFLWADTSNIPGAPATAEWTLWNVCDSINAGAGGRTTNCGSVRAANPFVPQQNFGTTDGVPGDFLSDRRTYYYLSRFAFAFYLISLFFMLCSLLTGILALCSRLGSALSAVASAWALFCTITCASLMTAVYVLGQSTFKGDGRSAGLGVYAFGFTWGSVGCMLVSTVLYCIGFGASRRHRHERSIEPEKRGGRFPYFGRSRPRREPPVPLA